MKKMNNTILVIISTITIIDVIMFCSIWYKSKVIDYVDDEQETGQEEANINYINNQLNFKV